MALRALGLLLFGIAPGLALLARAEELPYDFTIDSNMSGFNGTTYMAAWAQGSVIGTYEAARNPLGTRTKPGLGGPFGPDENIAVPALGTFAMAAQQATITSGGFRITFDRLANTMSFSNYFANLLSAGSQPGDSTVTIQTDGFQTRSPDGLIQGGSPRVIPTGTATLTQLIASQSGGSFGMLTPLTSNSYSFVAGVSVDLYQRVRILGQEYELPPIPYAFTFQGYVYFNGDTAELNSLQAVAQDDVIYPNAALPQLAFSLPTDLPPGGTADLLADLTVTQVISRINGDVSLWAFGTQVPEPATLLLTGAALLLGVRRRNV